MTTDSRVRSDITRTGDPTGSNGPPPAPSVTIPTEDRDNAFLAALDAAMRELGVRGVGPASPEHCDELDALGEALARHADAIRRRMGWARRPGRYEAVAS